METLDKILNYNDKTVKVVGTDKEPWFCGKDVCDILRYSKYRDALAAHVEQDCKKELSKVVVQSNWTDLREAHTETLSYNEGKAAYINKRGLESLLSKSKLAAEDGVVEDLIEKFSLNLNLVHRTKEQEFIGAIRTVFAHKNHQTQFAIGRYRIDLYFIGLRIAVECDELGHRDRDPIEEEERQRFIEEQLGCTFFRFNPDCKDFNIYKTINQLLKQIELKS